MKGWFACAALIGVAGIAGAAQAPQIAALGLIEPGQWQLRESGGDARTVCVADPRALLQIQHGMAQCSRFVIANDSKSATVHYTCPGAGHGRTTISVESGRLFQLHTQGIFEGAPFDAQYEARRIGGCGGGANGAGTVR